MASHPTAASSFWATVRWCSHLWLLALLLLVSCTHQESTNAKGGVLDLRGVDLRAAVVDLSGPWEVVPGQILTPAEISAYRGRMDTVRFPAFWKHAIPARCATFRMRVLFDTAKARNLAMATNQEISTYALWLNGKPLLERGHPASVAPSEVMDVGWREGYVPDRNGQLDLVMQVSNFEHGRQGHLNPIQLGSHQRIRRRLGLVSIPYLAGLGVLLAFAVHYLLILWPLTRDRLYLFFGLFCAARFATGVVSNVDCPFTGLLSLDISSPVRLLVGWIGIAASIWSACEFCEALFPDPLQRRLNQLQAATVVVAILYFLIAPMTMWSSFAPVLVDLGMFQAIFLVRLVVKALLQRQPSAKTFALGYGFMVVLSVHSAFYLLGLASGPIFLVLGSVALAFAEATALSQRFIAANAANVRLLTELQVQNAELERLTRLKDDFLANTSHELRTPLHGIAGMAQVLLTDSRNRLSGTVHRGLDRMFSSAMRLSRLVDDILDASKLRNHDLKLSLRAVNLSALVPGVLSEFEFLARDKHVKLHTEIEAGLPSALADEDRIVQVLCNLVGNAIRHTKQGEVRVSLCRMGGDIEVAVRDTGAGIPQEWLDRIFEPFEQVGSVRGGTGLGLPISRHLVELHGGRLEVSSAPGKGSCFHFCLPVTEEIPEATRMLQVPVTGQAEELTQDISVIAHREGVSRILVVDDEPINQEILRGLLNPDRFEVLSASDGSHVLELIAAHSPSLVLLDVMMPFRSGYEVCEEIRRLHASWELPVIFLSARNRMEDVVRGFAAGGNDYVFKPFLAEELLARVEAQLQQRDAILARQENDALKVHLAEAKLQSRELERTRDRLLALFQNLDDSLLVAERGGSVRFANAAFARRSRWEPQQLEDMDFADLFANAKALPREATERLELRLRVPAGGDVPVYGRLLELQADGEDLLVLMLEDDEPEAGATTKQILRRLSEGEQRLRKLQQQLEGSEDESCAEPLLQSDEIRRLVALREGVDERQLLAVELMNEVLALWCARTGGNKADLAEASGIWKIHPDANGWRRTATLDKYLALETIPRFPKWKNIQKTVEFVCQDYQDDVVVPALRSKAARLKQFD